MHSRVRLILVLSATRSGMSRKQGSSCRYPKFWVLFAPNWVGIGLWVSIFQNCGQIYLQIVVKFVLWMGLFFTYWLGWGCGWECQTTILLIPACLRYPRHLTWPFYKSYSIVLTYYCTFIFLNNIQGEGRESGVRNPKYDDVQLMWTFTEQCWNMKIMLYDWSVSEFIFF